MIIGFAGKAGSGKSTACKILKELGYTEFNFADPLKEIASVLSHVPLEYMYDQEQKEMPRDIQVSRLLLQEVLIHNGIYNHQHTEDFYRFTSIRKLLQWVGDVFRSQDKDFWVKLTITKLQPSKNYIIGDCRFQNEAQAITDLGGAVVKIVRPGTNKDDDHVSEKIDLISDYMISNTDLKLFKRDLLAVEGLIRRGKIQGQKR